VSYPFVRIEEVAYRLGIELRPEGQRLVGLCPLHGEQHGSFNVFVDTNSWFCFGCRRGGDPLKLVSSLVDGVRTWRELVRWYTEDSVSVRIPIRVTPPLDRVRELFSSKQVELPEANVSTDPFLASLGVLYVSQGRLAGRHIIPVTLGGALVAYEARDFFSRMVPKTLIQPPSVRIHSFLWNIDNVIPGSSIIVVEGIKGAIAVLKFGYPNVVSSFGAGLSTDQVALLMTKHPPDVTIVYDADAVGVAGATKAVAEMMAWADVYVVDLPTGTDPWDVSREVWVECLRCRERIFVQGRNQAVLGELGKRIFL
jgi:hypothetical protein